VTKNSQQNGRKSLTDIHPTGDYYPEHIKIKQKRK
jgi:hypothetical protein